MVAKVLVIEDDVELNREIEEALNRRGFAARGCLTLEDARQALRQTTPDVILSDVCLPDGDGVQFLREQRAAFPTTRWFLMSGNRDAILYEAGRNITIHDKPVAWHTLVDFIRAARCDWSH
jgi:two-component system OmpR family response regulator